MTKIDTSTEAVIALANDHQHVGDNPEAYIMGHPHHWKTADTLRALLRERDDLRTKLGKFEAMTMLDFANYLTTKSIAEIKGADHE